MQSLSISNYLLSPEHSNYDSLVPKRVLQYPSLSMKDLLLLLAHLLSTIAKLLGPGGPKSVVAQSLLMKQQLLIVNRSRRRAPRLSAFDRLQLGFWSLFLNPRHIRRATVIVRLSTLFKLHDILKKRKFRLLYSSAGRQKPGPKGPSPELVRAIVEIKQRNPRFGCRRIARSTQDVENRRYAVCGGSGKWPCRGSAVCS